MEPTPQLPLSIAPAAPTDFPAVRAILGSDRDASRLRAVVEHGQCWLARAGATPISFVVFAYTFFGFGFVETLATHPDYQQRGVATALMRHIESVCTTDRLFTSTNASNVRMQRLCLSLRYRVSGYVDNLDEGDPELIYVKRL